MGLTQISSNGIKDNEVKNADMADDAVGVAELSATGTASSSTFLRGDNSWSTPATIAFANDANNRVVTGTGSGLNGEANLTYDGTTLKNQVAAENGTIAHFTLSGQTNNPALLIKADESDQKITLRAGSDTSNYSSIAFNMGSVGDSVVVQTNGNLTISDGDLVIGTSGHGIDFSANSHAGGMTSELLDGYEEGTWTPAFNNAYSSVTYSTQKGIYVKIGRMVHLSFLIAVTAATAEGPGLRITGLPFTTHADNYSSGGITYVDLFSGFEKADPYVSGNVTEMRFYQKGSATQIATSGTSNITSEKYLGVGITYQV